MRSYTAEERKQNILRRAIKLGFAPSNEEFDESIDHATKFIYEHDTDRLRELCELTVDKTSRYLVWSDGMGYTYKEYGELITADWWKDNDKTEQFVICILNSEGRPVELYQERTFDVMFNLNGGKLIDDKGFHCSYNDCMSYIRQHNGTSESLFEKYRGGTVYIYCYETEEDVYWEEVR